jgi:hypothetical protein
MTDPASPAETLDLSPQEDDFCDCGRCSDCYAFNVMHYGVKEADEIFLAMRLPGQVRPEEKN